MAAAHGEMSLPRWRSSRRLGGWFCYLHTYAHAHFLPASNNLLGCCCSKWCHKDSALLTGMHCTARRTKGMQATEKEKEVAKNE